MSSTAVTMASSVRAPSSYVTVMALASKLTSTCSTPGSFATHLVTLAWQAAQVMPVTWNFSVFICGHQLS